MIETVNIASISTDEIKVLPRVVMQDTSDLIINFQNIYLNEPLCSLKIEWGDMSPQENIRPNFFKEAINNVRYYDIDWDQKHTYNPSSTKLAMTLICQVMAVYCNGEFSRWYIPVTIYSPSYHSRINDLHLISTNFLSKNDNDLLYTLHTSKNDQVVEITNEEAVINEAFCLTATTTTEEPTTTTVDPNATTTTVDPNATTTTVDPNITTTTTTVDPFATTTTFYPDVCPYSQCTGNIDDPTASCIDRFTGLDVGFNCDQCRCNYIAVKDPCPFSPCQPPLGNYPTPDCFPGSYWSCDACSCLPTCPAARCPNGMVRDPQTCHCVCPIYECSRNPDHPSIQLREGYNLDCRQCRGVPVTTVQPPIIDPRPCEKYYQDPTLVDAEFGEPPEDAELGDVYTYTLDYLTGIGTAAVYVNAGEGPTKFELLKNGIVVATSGMGGSGSDGDVSDNLFSDSFIGTGKLPGGYLQYQYPDLVDNFSTIENVTDQYAQLRVDVLCEAGCLTEEECGDPATVSEYTNQQPGYQQVLFTDYEGDVQISLRVTGAQCWSYLYQRDPVECAQTTGPYNMYGITAVGAAGPAIEQILAGEPNTLGDSFADTLLDPFMFNSNTLQDLSDVLNLTKLF
jgi:hypothetical protein